LNSQFGFHPARQDRERRRPQSGSDRQLALAELVHAIQHYRKVADSKPLTLLGSEYPQAVQELNKAIDRAEGLL
jgi:hypothetical protein